MVRCQCVERGIGQSGTGKHTGHMQTAGQIVRRGSPDKGFQSVKGYCVLGKMAEYKNKLGSLVEIGMLTTSLVCCSVKVPCSCP